MFRLLNPRPQLSAFTTHQVKHLRNRLAKVARGNVWFWKKNANSLVLSTVDLNLPEHSRCANWLQCTSEHLNSMLFFRS